MDRGLQITTRAQVSDRDSVGQKICEIVLTISLAARIVSVMVELRLGGDFNTPMQVYVCLTPKCTQSPLPAYSAPTCGKCGKRMSVPMESDSDAGAGSS